MRWVGWGLLATALVACLLSSNLGAPVATASTAGAPASTAVVPSDASGCHVDEDKSAEPAVVLLGETVAITLRVRVICGSDQFPLHLVMVLDESASMEGQPIALLKTAASLLVQRLDLPGHPSTKVGVVGFNHQARRLTALSNRDSAVLGAIARLRAQGQTRIDLGIQMGLAVLNQGREGLGRNELTEALLVVSDGLNNAGSEPVLAAARNARAQGVLVVAVCAGPDCDRQTMRQVASAPRYYFEANSPGELIAVFQEIQRRLRNIAVRKLQVKDVLSDEVELVPGSVQPEQAQPTTIDRWVLWEDLYVPSEGVTYTLSVRPLKTGYIPTNQSAEGVIEDNRGQVKEWRFEVPWVTVLEPRGLATPITPVPTSAPPATPTDLPPPTPTDTPLPTAPPAPSNTPTVPPSPTPTPTATVVPAPLYLPIALRQRCETWRIHADVAVVVDVSTSMDRRTASGRTKLAAVLEAAGEFVGGMQLTADATGRHDRVAVVGFHSDAWVQVPIGADAGEIAAGLAGLEARRREGTRLDLAFERGAGALLTADDIGNRRFMVVLTDGLPNRVPASDDGTMATTVVRAADAAKARGIGVFTIGVGRTDPAAELVDRVDAVLLTACATTPGWFYLEPDAEALGTIYRDIYDEITTCR